MSQFISAVHRWQEKKVEGWLLLSFSANWERTTPIPVLHWGNGPGLAAPVQADFLEQLVPPLCNMTPHEAVWYGKLVVHSSVVDKTISTSDYFCKSASWSSASGLFSYVMYMYVMLCYVVMWIFLLMSLFCLWSANHLDSCFTFKLFVLIFDFRFTSCCYCSGLLIICNYFSFYKRVNWDLLCFASSTWSAKELLKKRKTYFLVELWSRSGLCLWLLDKLPHLSSFSF